MNCKQCGAPMVLHRERDFYHCEYCGAYHFPQSSSEGIRRLGKNPEGIKCPLCKIPFHMVTFDDRFRGYQCPNCQGLLFARQTFRKTIDSRRANATTDPIPAPRFADSELERQIDCPICHQQMNTHAYMGPGNIVVDNCDPCDVLWLDYGELKKVVDAPGRDRGPSARIESDDTGKARKQKKGKKHKDKLDLSDLLNALLD